MQCLYTKYASVGVVLIVVLSFLSPSNNGIAPESIAWADVQRAMEKKVQSARVTGTRNCFFGDDEEPAYKLNVEKLFSPSCGFVDRTYMEDGRLIIEFTYHIPTGQWPFCLRRASGTIAWRSQRRIVTMSDKSRRSGSSNGFGLPETIASSRPRRHRTSKQSGSRSRISQRGLAALGRNQGGIECSVRKSIVVSS